MVWNKYATIWAVLPTSVGGQCFGCWLFVSACNKRLRDMAGLRKTFEFLSRSLFITHSLYHTIGQRERECVCTYGKWVCSCVREIKSKRVTTRILSPSVSFANEETFELIYSHEERLGSHLSVVICETMGRVIDIEKNSGRSFNSVFVLEL